VTRRFKQETTISRVAVVLFCRINIGISHGVGRPVGGWDEGRGITPTHQQQHQQQQQKQRRVSTGARDSSRNADFEQAIGASSTLFLLLPPGRALFSFSTSFYSYSARFILHVTAATGFETNA
jgi:hypothetical protein